MKDKRHNIQKSTRQTKSDKYSGEMSLEPEAVCMITVFHSVKCWVEYEKAVVGVCFVQLIKTHLGQTHIQLSGFSAYFLHCFNS